MTRIIDGAGIAAEICSLIEEGISTLKADFDLVPRLRVIIVGNNPASQIYVRNKQKKAESVGIDAKTIALPEDTSESELVALIHQLNDDEKVNGILLQLPIPKHIDANKVIPSIRPDKDVDGFHPQNIGKLVLGKDAPLKPCTPTASIYLIKTVLGNDLKGLDAVVIGRSNIVGKPMATLLLHEDCTVTITHSKTKDIQEKTMHADIVVAAVGIPRFVKGNFIKSGATVIDVGINKVDAEVVGDVDFQEVSGKAGFITPVPKGVGPMTIAFLMLNTVVAACMQNAIDYERIVKLDF
ncbi:tetrahydrofolate dehydrogenase/cyclohydrolase, catalytic domain protein [Neorickettsia helminthoeca str. Oregon]|uniref:Bifunctional protein FolD n=1 Tax=Neorickettsia helminthoeca str. Oregon TaxID=1286528 RepID=X5HMK8_9RICK|nr:tetrahydrofolate dehydrogenase/cyclohydrolase catalytic domain-containing protein [Neorickettsia helminthoeca]AHX11710.1 tetrahydrofolate dehydrogenase/cyclohydrolase, catalytic domain protein [Neorickettsia helminthoeca str. Oregon]